MSTRFSVYPHMARNFFTVAMPSNSPLESLANDLLAPLRAALKGVKVWDVDFQKNRYRSSPTLLSPVLLDYKSVVNGLSKPVMIIAAIGVAVAAIVFCFKIFTFIPALVIVLVSAKLIILLSALLGVGISIVVSHLLAALIFSVSTALYTLCFIIFVIAGIVLKAISWVFEKSVRENNRMFAEMQHRIMNGILPTDSLGNIPFKTYRKAHDDALVTYSAVRGTKDPSFNLFAALPPELFHRILSFSGKRRQKALAATSRSLYFAVSAFAGRCTLRAKLLFPPKLLQNFEISMFKNASWGRLKAIAQDFSSSFINVANNSEINNLALEKAVWEHGFSEKTSCFFGAEPSPFLIFKREKTILALSQNPSNGREWHLNSSSGERGVMRCLRHGNYDFSGSDGLRTLFNQMD